MFHLVLWFLHSLLSPLYLLLLLLPLLSLRLFLSFRSLPPGPWGIPYIGYLPFLDPRSPYLTLTKLSSKYGRVFSIQLGRVFTVVVTDPKLVRHIFSLDNYTGRAPLYLTHGIMQGYGLVCSEGDSWREQRKFAQGVLRRLGMVKFGPGRDKMQERIMGSVHEFIKFVREEGSGGRPVDIYEMLLHIFGNMTNSMVFGIKYQRDDPVWIWLMKLLDEGINKVTIAGPLNFLPILRFLPRYRQLFREIKQGQNETHKHYQEIIDMKAKLLSKVNSWEDSDETKNFLCAYLQEMQRRDGGSTGHDTGSFTIIQLYHILADLFGAGTDTAMTVVKWFLIHMAVHTDIQVKIQAEIDDMIGRERDPDADDMTEMPFTEATILEVQRMKSVTPLGIPHGTIEETTLDGYVIPAGTMILPVLWTIHMDPDLWINPEQFNPERFIDPEDGKTKRPDCFMPFQTGRRMCLGEEMARVELFLFCATILQQFTVRLPEGVTYDLNQPADCGVTLVPKRFNLLFLPRQNSEH